MKLTDIRHFRNKKNAYPEAKFEELETDSKIRNIWDLYRGISDFKNGYQPRTRIVKMRKVTWLQTPTVFSLGGVTISPMCWMYIGLMMLGGQKYIQQSH